MDSKELMIGDWAEFRPHEGEPFYAQVEGVESCTITRHEWFHDTRVFPIPLTDEILANNGFIKKNDDRVLYVHINEYNGFCLRLKPDDYGWYLYNNRLIRVDDVHVLQHILRICGVEKEVEL